MRRDAATPVAWLGLLLAASQARATPGPDSVAVVSNADVPGSVALAEAYAAARDLPAGQHCSLPLPPGPDLPLDDFRDRLEAPLRACLAASGALPRVEAVVLTRGVPLRVVVPTPGGATRVSVAAALSLWDTSVVADASPLLGHPPGRQVPCGEGGATCLGAAWRNAYSGGRFEPGWTLESVGVRWAPLLVTALFGRSDEDAARLIDSAVRSEGQGPGDGELLLMEGADPARGLLDAEYDRVLQGLQDRGQPVRRVPFDPDLTGLRLAGLVTGTAGLGRTIEGNDYLPGALVDNLTSFGAVAENFAPEGESQVSIARWVARGVAGVHGTTDEPLNNCFPSRAFLLDYADGATLAEAFWSNLPFAYWHNLVLGDPMTAPYAVRPEVEILPPAEAGEGWLRLAVRDPAGRGGPEVIALADGAPVALTDAAAWVAPSPRPVRWLVVAQAQDDGRRGGFWRPKGWTAVTLDFAPAEGPAPDAALPEPDAGASEPDAASPEPDSARPSSDGAPPEADAAAPAPDATPPASDAAAPGRDAAMPFGDAAAAATDAASPDTDAAPAAAEVTRVPSSQAGGCHLAGPRGRSVASLLLPGLLLLRRRRRPPARRRVDA